MVDIHGYTVEEERTQQKIRELKQTLKQKDVVLCDQRKIKKQIDRLQKDLKDYYFNKATSNKLPQTYLYAPYERRYRFFKIFQMFQKLLIVVVSMFFGNWAFSQFKMLSATSVVGVFAIVNAITRPFNDNFEDVMEILSQFSNTINVFVALGLEGGFVSDKAALYLLLIFNGATVVVFGIATMISPFLFCIRNIEYTKLARLAQEKAKAVAQTFSADDIGPSGLAKSSHAALPGVVAGAAAGGAAMGAGAALGLKAVEDEERREYEKHEKEISRLHAAKPEEPFAAQSLPRSISKTTDERLAEHVHIDVDVEADERYAQQLAQEEILQHQQQQQQRRRVHYGDSPFAAHQ